MRIVIPEKQDFKPVPSGVYGVALEKTEIAPTSKGSQMLKIQWKITDDFAGDGETKVKGRIIFDQYVLVETALWKLITAIEVISGEPMEVGSEWELDDLIEHAITIFKSDGIKIQVGPKAYRNNKGEDVEGNEVIGMVA